MEEFWGLREFAEVLELDFEKEEDFRPGAQRSKKSSRGSGHRLGDIGVNKSMEKGNLC